MNTVARLIVVACVAVVGFVPAAATATSMTPANESTVVAAKAPAKRFKVVQKWQQARLEACKVSVKKDTAWKVYGRLDTRKIKAGKYAGTLLVMKDGNDMPVATWRSPMVKKGKFSKVGSVVLPKEAGYSLGAGIGTSRMGNGGPVSISNVRKC